MDRNVQLPPQLIRPFKVAPSSRSLEAEMPINDISQHFPKLADTSLLECVEGGKELGALRVGVVLSGGQASGGHNVICGIYDYLNDFAKGSQLIAYLNGPKGVIVGDSTEITPETVDDYRNVGGFQWLGSGRDKIEGEELLSKAFKTVQADELDGLIIIGGDDSNTNAAVLGEYIAEHGGGCVVIGVPKTIDGDLQNAFVDISFGFDTATKIYSETIGNICFDALSAKKYFHFIRLMGRSASHVTLECALQTQPNFVLIGEEIRDKQITLEEIGQDLAKLVIERNKAKKPFGVVLVPEGLLEFIPEMKGLFSQIQDLVSAKKEVRSNLSEEALKTFDSFPESFQAQLTQQLDPHGNVKVSQIATEELLIRLTKKYLAEAGYEGTFNPLGHFLGYEGRCGPPTDFDAIYCLGLGRVAAALVGARLNGYMSAISGLANSPDKWKPFALPLVSLIHMEKRHGKLKPVIRKALVDLDLLPFQQFAKQREGWKIEDQYRCPGPYQFTGKPVPPKLLEG
ncbi:MAG: Pyrophosphate--fructose 6-phosphate 1-phosphotransferase [Chlamydiia bacterium]|nr:Pyrophosphate--fructose 6-phosphate 1-phosphotransferase [Chlamydiia bacterium]